MSLFNTVHSSRRPSALKDTDYDHEIRLVDHTLLRVSTPSSPGRSRSPSQAPSGEAPPGSEVSSLSQRAGDVILQKKSSIQKEVVRRRYAKYQDRRPSNNSSTGEDESDADVIVQVMIPTPIDEGEEHRGRPRSKSAHKERDSAIDILFENERGGFLCGIPLFSSKALGNLDPSPWTNVAQKTSATNPKNAQVPDPSWEWTWKEWVVNHDDEMDEDGWEYSFAFSKKFSWHGPSWWNSFVRRRAWIRKRAKVVPKHQVQEAHMLTSDYFTIHPKADTSRSSSRVDSIRDSRYRFSVASLAKQEMEKEEKIVICDITHLLAALKAARIDREKTEAVENFVENGGDDLFYLRERMHDIMGQFIFQASRKLFVAHLSRMYDEATLRRKACQEGGEEQSTDEAKRVENLEAALKHADEEVRRLEYWSDQQQLVREGDTKTATDEKKGWGDGWDGLDNSAPSPEAVQSRPTLRKFTTAYENAESTGKLPVDNEKVNKGKEKEDM